MEVTKYTPLSIARLLAVIFPDSVPLTSPQIGQNRISAPFRARILETSGNELSQQIRIPIVPKSVVNTGKVLPGTAPCSVSESGNWIFSYIPCMLPFLSYRTAILFKVSPVQLYKPETMYIAYCFAFFDIMTEALPPR